MSHIHKKCSKCGQNTVSSFSGICANCGHREGTDDDRIGKGLAIWE